MRSVQFLGLLVGLFLIGCLGSSPSQELTDSEQSVAREGLHQAVRHARLVGVDVTSMAEALTSGSQIQIELPGAGPVELEVQGVREVVPGVTTFSGKIVGDETSEYTLSIEAGKLVGAIRQGANAWLVEPHAGSAKHRIRLLDRTLLPKDEPSLKQATGEPSKAQHGTFGATSIMSTGNVRVLFLHATDVSNANAHAANIVATFNDSLAASAVSGNNYLSVAGVQQVASTFDDQNRFAIISAMSARQAPFAAIDAAMDSTAADVAFLLVSEDGDAADVAGFGRVGGIAYLLNQGNPFALSTVSYALGDLTALHELGHVFGGQHENGAGLARPVVAPDDTWMTVMGGYIECPFVGLPATCVRLNRWSNPDQTYLGIPLGVAGQRDMESHLEENMPMVSAWRPDPSPADMSSPVPGSTLGGAAVTFSWTAGSGVSHYYLYVGSSVGAADLYGASQGLSTSATVSGLPTDGRTLYVRLWSLIGGGWQFRDYTYTAAVPAVPAAIIVPVPGSALPGAVVTFSWTTGSGVSQYYLYVGSSVGAADFYGASQGLATSATVSGLPIDGRTLYVRLWSLIGGGWQFRDYTYTAAVPAVPAAITSPTPGSTLAGAAVTLSWTAGSGVSLYYLYVGSSFGAADLYAASHGTATSATVTGLPTDGRTLYVRLWSLIGGGWQYRDYTYTAASSCHPLAGTHGQIWMPVSAQSQYVYNAGWCTVGHGLPEMCFEGTYFYYQNLQSSYCSSVGSSGSCYDGDAWWHVTCDSLVDCIYNCSGQCVKADC